MSVVVKAAVIHRYGAPEVFSFEDVTVSDPGAGEARIRNSAIGLNFVDVYYRRGTMPVPSFPAIIGNEGVGIVDAIGPGVTSVKVGDRVVYGDSAYGSYTAARLHPADRLVLIPDKISDEQAAASFLKGLTARFLLKEIVVLQPGDTVLYHAAAGGVGQIFVQWAKALGLRVIGTVSDDSKGEIARSMGCDEIINYRTENFVARTLELTSGVGVKAVFDAVGKDTFLGSLSILKPRGTLVMFGNASGYPSEFPPFDLAPRSLNLTWAILPHFTETAQDIAAGAADLFDAILSGKIKVDPSSVYPFERLVDAHHDLEERRTVGSAIMRI